MTDFRETDARVGLGGGMGREGEMGVCIWTGKGQAEGGTGVGGWILATQLCARILSNFPLSFSLTLLSSVQATQEDPLGMQHESSLTSRRPLGGLPITGCSIILLAWLHQ